jgi:DNA polymerase-3 subunit gamma/tau
MSLANKLRPSSLKEIVGNTDLVRTLETLLTRDRNRVPHAFLLTGPSGCGKTTLARIIAQMLGCSSINFNEIDSADFRGIDSVREIRSNMNWAPLAGESCRVWLLDECHAMTKDAQTALLKALEDAPSHVYFILATTDPEKLLPTLKSRCKTGEFAVTPVDEDLMFSFLRKSARTEGKVIPPEILKTIVRHANGSCRNALGVLDQLMDLAPEEMQAVAERDVQREVETIELCRAMMERKGWKIVSGMLESLLEKEAPEDLRLSMIGYASKVLLSGKENDAAYLVLDAFRESTYVNKKAGLILCAYEALLSAES